MLDTLFENLTTLYRERKGLSVMELCDKLGISVNYYYQFRSSKYQYLKRDRIDRIAEALELTEDEAAVLWTAAQFSNRRFEIGEVNSSIQNIRMLYSIYEAIKYMSTVDACSSSLILGSSVVDKPTENPGWYVLDTGKEKILTYIQKVENSPYTITYVRIQASTNEPVIETTEYPYWKYDEDENIKWYPVSFDAIITSPDLSSVDEAVKGGL